jgi:hypothetical protein
MPAVLRPPFALVARLVRLLALLAWGGQLGIAIAPLIDAHGGPGAGVHVEAQGLTRHYAHAPDQCWACAAHAIVALPPVPRVPESVAGAPSWTPGPRREVAAAPRLIAAAPRAPPVRESGC